MICLGAMRSVFNFAKQNFVAGHAFASLRTTCCRRTDGRKMITTSYAYWYRPNLLRSFHYRLVMLNFSIAEAFVRTVVRRHDIGFIRRPSDGDPCGICVSRIGPDDDESRVFFYRGSALFASSPAYGRKAKRPSRQLISATTTIIIVNNGQRA